MNGETPMEPTPSLPFVIDNREVRLGDVIARMISLPETKALDIATAFLDFGALRALLPHLQGLASFRLLIGAEPDREAPLGLRPDPDAVSGLIRQELETTPLDPDTARAIEDLIAFLRRDTVAVRRFARGFLHAKCYLAFADGGPRAGTFDRMLPLWGIVGSSNCTRAGLFHNRELNLSHRVLLDGPGDPVAAETVARLKGRAPGAPRPDDETVRDLQSEVGARAVLDLARWYAQHFDEAEDFKDRLIEILDASKFGRREYTPYQIFLKSLLALFEEDLRDDPGPNPAPFELTEFQQDAVRKARHLLDRFDGVLIADATGLGKTWIGKRLLDDLAYHSRKKALVVCPAALREMWDRELREAAIAAKVVSHEEMGRQEFDPAPFLDVDVVLVDESHAFRNNGAARYEALFRIVNARNGIGRSGDPKKVVLLTATPIHNDLWDLYHQVNLIAKGNRGHFAGAEIGDLLRFFKKAQKRAGGGALFPLLEAVSVRRSRAFIREHYPDARLNGDPVRFPDRRLTTLRYRLEDTYQGIYDRVVQVVEGLHMAPYRVEEYRKGRRDAMEEGREQALCGIFRSRLLKRLESSVPALLRSTRALIAYFDAFRSFLLDGRLLTSDLFRKALSALRNAEEDEDGLEALLPGPGAGRIASGILADRLEGSEAAAQVLAAMEEVHPEDFDLRSMHRDIEEDLQALRSIEAGLASIGPDQDAKWRTFLQRLIGEARGRKVLIFTYYKDTATYLRRNLEAALAQDPWRDGRPPRIRQVDSGVPPRERTAIVQAFAPRSNGRPDLPADQEVDILVATDALSEGQNLQDCGLLWNYDLHWNPMRMVQRAGRIDRLKSLHAEVVIGNVIPEDRLEDLLHLVERLEQKARQVDEQSGTMEVPIFEGQAVHPRDINAIRRIKEEDGRVIDDLERESELPTSESMIQILKTALAQGLRSQIEALPDGIHSGKRASRRGLFFHFRAGDRHFWRFVDADTGEIEGNRHDLAGLIRCGPDEPRLVDPALRARVYDLQERAIEDILRSVEADSARETHPPILSKEQNQARGILENALGRPGIDGQAVRKALRSLGRPWSPGQSKALGRALASHKAAPNPATLLARVLAIAGEDGSDPAPATIPTADAPAPGPSPADPGTAPLRREDLRLVCYEVLNGP